MARRGNADVNSLLKSNMTARQEQLAYNDQAAAFNWDVSEKSQADLDEYTTYLKKRQGETPDQSKNLSLQSKIVSAQRGFTSAEIGRQTISVLYGDTNNRDKFGVIERLMQQAAENGDASLFQQLDETRARLSKTIQDEESAGAASGAAAASAATTKGLTAQMNQWKQGEALLDSAFKAGRPITDATGAPVLVKYVNGKPQLDGNNMPIQDPNGKPLVMGAREYAAMKGVLLRQQQNVIEQQIANGDDTGSHQLALDNLRNSGDYQKYATDEAAQRIGSNVNRYVTKIDKDGNRTFGLADTQPVQRTDKDGMPVLGEYDQAPLNGRVTGTDGKLGNKYVGSYTVGSDPNGPLDQFQGETQRVDTKGQQFALGKDAKTGEPVKAGGFGVQDVLANPKAGTVLPDGRVAQAQVYAPGSAEYHYSIAPFKKDAQGNDILDKSGNHVAFTPSDFPEAPANYDLGNATTNIVDGLKGTAKSVLKNKVGNAIFGGLASVVSPMTGGLINTVGNLLQRGDLIRAEQAKQKAEAAASKAKQQAAIDAANAALEKQSADRIAAAAKQAKVPAAGVGLSGGKVTGLPGAPNPSYYFPQGIPASQSAKGLPGLAKPWYQL